jgi:hypothetical protein
MIVGGYRQLLSQSTVKPMQTLTDICQPLAEIISWRQFRQTGDDQLTGDIASTMTAHTVGYDPKAPLWRIEKRILVARSNFTGMGMCRTSPGGAKHHQSCTGIRKPRSTFVSKGFGIR